MLKLRSQPRVVKILLFYALVVSVLVGLGLMNDASAENAYTSSTYGWAGEGTSFITGFVVAVFAYAVRLSLLLAPLGKNKPSARGWLTGGILASLIPELIIIGVSFSFLTEQSGTCSTGGDFSNCGWGWLVLILLFIIAGIAQLIGMLIGRLVGRLRGATA
ncbi:MAG TPA: hypothetical protein VFP35_03220 [Candidatus Saccharimonadales bacterium]|nr:hypothetical protein [Candidatus Saccharimonadales bacterium]